jgi:hypothetical protein
MAITTLQTNEELELVAKKLEVVLHPAWHGVIDEENAAIALQDKPVMTYLLRQGNEGELDFWLSHKKESGEIHHRHFTVRLFPDGLIFANISAPPCENIDDFIRGALACKS